MTTSRDAEDKQTRLFDIRTIARNIKKGLTSRKDYDKHLKSLPDIAEKAAPVEEDSLDAAGNIDDNDVDADDLDDAEPRGRGPVHAPVRRLAWALAGPARGPGAQPSCALAVETRARGA